MTVILINYKTIKKRNNNICKFLLPDPLIFTFNENFIKSYTSKSPGDNPGTVSLKIPFELINAYNIVCVEKEDSQGDYGAISAFNLVGDGDSMQSWTNEKEIPNDFLSNSNYNNMLSFNSKTSSLINTTSKYTTNANFTFILKNAKSNYILIDDMIFEVNYSFLKAQTSSGVKYTKNVNGIFPTELIQQFSKVTICNKISGGAADGTIFGNSNIPQSYNIPNTSDIINNDFSLTSSTTNTASISIGRAFEITLHN